MKPGTRCGQFFSEYRKFHTPEVTQEEADSNTITEEECHATRKWKTDEILSTPTVADAEAAVDEHVINRDKDKDEASSHRLLIVVLTISVVALTMIFFVGNIGGKGAI